MFDPYRKWLGISPKDQPPNHYRLLGVELFETDLDVIEGAADKQMAFVRQYQSGEHAPDAAKILNELAAARLCLLKPTTKDAYDEKLKKELQPQPSSPATVAAPVAETVVVVTAPELSDLAHSEPASGILKKGKKSGVSPLVMIGGGSALVLGVLLVVFVMNSGKTPPPKEPDKVASTTTQTPKVTTPDSTRPTSNPVKIPDQKATVEPAGDPIDLVKTIDLTRDVMEGTWKQTDTALIGERHSRLYFPVTPPEDYQLKFKIRRVDGIDTLAMGFMMGGRQGMLILDGWNSTWSGLCIDGREASSNATSKQGRQFSGENLATIVLTVHPRHFHAAFNNQTLVDWFGDPERLSLHFGIPSRQSPYLVTFQTKYVVESATLTPIKPEPEQQRPDRLEQEVDLMPFVNLERDMASGMWTLNKDVLTSPEHNGRTNQAYLPTIVPREYTLSATVEMQAAIHGDALTMGLVAGDSYFQFTSTNGATGLDMIDGRRWDNNETRLAGPLLKPGIPVRLDCTVTKDAVRVQADGKTIVDWKGDFRRLGMPGDWALADSRRLCLGTTRQFKIRDIKIGPPLPAPKIPQQPTPAIGKPIDLLALIDPARDAVTGTWERDGKNVRTMADTIRSKLVIPVDPPTDYKLTVKVARESNDQALILNLPIGDSKAGLVIDGAGKTVSGVYVDEVDFGRFIPSYRSILIPQGPAQEFVCFVRGNGIKVMRGDTVVVDWTGNPDRLVLHPELQTPGRRIGLVSWDSKFRFEKLELEALAPTNFPAPTPVGNDGNLLAVLNAARDSQRADWKLTPQGLLTPRYPVARISIPVTPPDKYVLSATVERQEGGQDIFFGLPVGKHTCAVLIDGVRGFEAGVDHLDGKRFDDAMNLTHRNYGAHVLPDKKSVKVRCYVLPDTIVCTCDGQDLIRWHGDPRRLSLEPSYLPANYSATDREQLWLGCFNTSFLIRELKLEPLTPEMADEIASSFNGVFPTSRIPDGPLALASTSPAPKTTISLSTNPGIQRLPVPAKSAIDAAQNRINKSYAFEFKSAQKPEAKSALAEKLLKNAMVASDPPADRYAHFVEARELYMQNGDLLAVFRIADLMSADFELGRYEEKADLLQKMAKKANGAAQHRIVAVVCWKLAGDAAADEDYATAREVCQRAIAAARATSEPSLQNRATEKLRYYESLFNQWKAAKSAEATLKQNPEDAAAHAVIGEYLCWVRKDWVDGLPSLARSSDTTLSDLVKSDLANPKTPVDQTALAARWIAFAKSQKSAVTKASAAERATIWYEKAIPGLPADAKSKSESDLEAAYEIANGRAFKKVLAQEPNGVEVDETVDCAKDVRALTLKKTFDIRKSWILSFEFNPPHLNGGWHQIFFWGDGAGGDDPLWVRVDGNRVSAVVENIVENRGQGIDYYLPANAAGQWHDLKFVYDGVAGNIELYINHRLIRRESLTMMPAVDRGMPLFLGGTDPGGQRFTGQVRKVWLGNLP